MGVFVIIERVTPGEFVSSRLAPFKIREYRRLYFAQSLSWIGSWMQDMGKSWIVLSQFGRGSKMGLLMIAAALPVACFSIYAGVFVDKRNPRTVLLVTQFSLFMTALMLGVLAYFGHLQYWHMIVLAVFEGMAIAFDAPAFQVMIPRLVGRENLQQSIALNSSSFHLSRILGPALGGLLLAAFGASSIFTFNAISFLLVCYTVYQFKSIQAYAPNHLTTGAFKEFLQLLWSNPFFVRILVQFLLIMTFVFPHTFTTLRILVTDRFHLDGRGFGIALTGPGIGAFLGSTMMVVLKPQKPYSIFPYGLAGLTLAGSALIFCNDFWMMNILLTIYTFSLFLYLSSLMLSLQLMTENHLRGRLSALVTLVFGAVAPLFSALWGWASDQWGSTDVFAVTGIAFLFLSLLVIVYWDRFFAPRVLASHRKMG